VNSNFKSFVDSKKTWNEVAGVSRGYIEFPVDFAPMANLFMFIHGKGLRARALNWIVTTGLMQASRGRDKLFELVKVEVEKLQGSPLKMTTARNVQNIQPSQKVAGVHEMARSVIGNWGRDPDELFTSHDLFSPEAWSRLPILKQVKINGETIHEYYHHNLEPTLMILDSDNVKGQQLRINLVEIYDHALHVGIRPFTYGGFDGYIQYIEKGDWLEDHEKRAAISPNKQFGVDVRPEKELNKETGELEDVKDAEDFDRNGKPIFNFQGGSVSVDADRAEQVINAMRHDFVNKAKEIQANNPLNDADPRDVENWKRLLSSKDLIEKIEAGVNDKDVGRDGPVARAGFPEYGKNMPIKAPFPNNIEKNQFIKIIQDGLNSPITRKINSFENPSAFGELIEDANNPPQTGGWYSISGDNLTYKMNDIQQKGVFNYIFRDIDKNNTMNSNFKCARVPELRDAKPADNTKINLSSLLSKGFKADPELSKGIKTVIYTLKGIDPKKYVNEQASIRKEVNPNPQANDPLINYLKSNGYEWELNTKQEKKDGHPLLGYFSKRPNASIVGFLQNKGSRYKVELDVNDGKWYLYVHVNKNGKPVIPPKFGRTGSAILSGSKGMKYGGGDKGGHLDMNPVGKQTWEILKNRLLQGEEGGLGEMDENKGPFNNIMELPCVKYGVNIAKEQFNTLHGNDQWFSTRGFKVPSDMFEGNAELLGIGAERLPSIANDPAFQIGWITEKEHDAFIGRNGNEEQKWDLEAELEKEKESELELDSDKKKKKGGKGIYSILHRHNITDDDPAEAKKIRDNIINWIQNNIRSAKDGMIIDMLWEKDPLVARAFAENGYKWRSRMIGKYVLARMKERAMSEKNKNPLNSLDGMGGEDGSIDVDSNQKSHWRGAYDDNDKKSISPEELAKFSGLEMPEKDVSPSFNPKNRVPAINQPISGPTTTGGNQPLSKPKPTFVKTNYADPSIATTMTTGGNQPLSKPKPTFVKTNYADPSIATTMTTGGNQPLSKPPKPTFVKTNYTGVHESVVIESDKPIFKKNNYRSKPIFDKIAYENNQNK
jgi:hypothetical protein